MEIRSFLRLDERFIVNVVGSISRSEFSWEIFLPLAELLFVYRKNEIEIIRAPYFVWTNFRGD